MRLPDRPKTINELETLIESGRLRESHHLEFKREFPEKGLAKHIAGLAADGGVLVIGIEETKEAESGFRVKPIDCNGARERVEHIARDRPEPSVDVESYILDAEDSGFGVLWVVIPPSPHLLHQVDGPYYGRGDTETRSMDDAEVSERQAFRRNRKGPIVQALDAALQREEPSAAQHFGRTCIVARPFGAPEDEFYQSTSERDAWESFAQAISPPFRSHLPNRYLGRIGQWVKDSPQPFDSHLALATYCEIELQDSGAFCHLSYSLDWYEGNDKGIYLGSVLEACRHALCLILAIQSRTGQRRMWDLAFSITGVKGRIVRSPRDQFFFPLTHSQLPQNAYRRLALGVSTECLKDDLSGVVKELAGRFVAEAGLEFEQEWRFFLNPR